MNARRRRLRTQRMSIRSVLTVVLAVTGLAAFTASAYATFTLNSGTLKLTNGTTTGTPPKGSWVELLNKDIGGAPFNNPLSTAEDHDFTLIDGSTATGLLLGRAQPNGGIFGPLTFFGPALFSVDDRTAPSLLFSGSAKTTTARTLVGGFLDGLEILYNGGLYNVGTHFGTGQHIVQGLLGTITGDATLPGKATILLTWQTALLEPGFSLYNASFHWEGVYTP